MASSSETYPVISNADSSKKKTTTHISFHVPLGYALAHFSNNINIYQRCLISIDLYTSVIHLAIHICHYDSDH